MDDYIREKKKEQENKKDKALLHGEIWLFLNFVPLKLKKWSKCSYG